MPFQPGRFANRTPTSLAIAAALMAACPALAMQQQDEDDPPLLSGPVVDAEAERATLVRRDFSGDFQRLERHPAEAALDLVREIHHLNEEQAKAIDAILTERRRVLDELVIDRLDVLIKLANGGSDADRAEAIAVLRRAMAPIMRKGQLGDRIRRHLPTDAATEHQRLEREYLDAAIEDRVELLEAENGGMGERGLRLRARAIEMLVGLGAEVKGAYERTIVQQGQRVEELIAHAWVTALPWASRFSS